MGAAFLAGALTALCAIASGAQAASHPPKLVYYGWGLPTWMHAATHAAEMEEMPFDGTGIAIPIDRAAWERGQRDTSNQFGWAVFGKRAFRAADFADAIAELRATKWKRFTENFLPAVINSAAQSEGFSWFDDQRWNTIVRNWVLLLKIARRAGCRGIILDPEDYGGDMFDHGAMAARHPGGFEAYQQIVRARGRQLMTAGRGAFPGLVILGLFGPSLPLDAGPDELASHPYGLVASFVDGLVEGADPGLRFVDGGEFSYGFRHRREFLRLRGQIESAIAARSTLPRERRRQIEVGFALWIDKGGPRQWDAEKPWGNYFTPMAFGDALQAALAVTDGYVWIYSEGPRFFPPHSLPSDYVDAMIRARRGHPFNR